ncbi:MAG: ABC transporter substrate-binding protein [Candidatus Hermodarchaeota archaeon]
MKNEIKSIIIIILSVCLGFSSYTMVYRLFKLLEPPPEIIDPTWYFTVGMPEGPSDLDPLLADNDASKDVIEQVCEGLFMQNLSDPNLGIVPRLAREFGSWDSSGTRFTILLRQNVSFHDGTPFNAEAVKWNFERIRWFINGTSTLNSTLSPAHSIWKLPNGTLILNQTNFMTINDEYNVTINLCTPYSILESILCHVSAYILSPESTPKYKYISTRYGRLLGTGPFVYENYVVDKNLLFHRWEKYWREPAFFANLMFGIITKTDNRNNAMLGHTIEYLIGPKSSLFPTFDADPSIILNNEKIGVEYCYLALRNTQINSTWRKAISYAINYTYIFEELLNENALLVKSPRRSSYFECDSPTIAPNFNLTKAREIVVNMGFGDMNWSDSQWKASEFAIWNYTYNIGNDFQEDLYVLLQETLDLVGIKITDSGLAWGGVPPPNYLELIRQFIFNAHLRCPSWNPDYLDPMNTFLALFSNQYIPMDWEDIENDINTNLAFVNDSWLEYKFNDALRETNKTARAIIYSEIQHYISEELNPHAFGFHPKLYYVHAADIQGVPYNALGRLYIYPMFRR